MNNYLHNNYVLLPSIKGKKEINSPKRFVTLSIPLMHKCHALSFLRASYSPPILQSNAHSKSGISAT